MSGFVATSYGPPWGGIEGQGVTSTGVKLGSGAAGRPAYLVAVDPGVIAYGSKLRIWPNPFGNPNIIFTAQDTGGAIRGNRIDFYDWRGRTKQNGWGRRTVNVSVVGKGPRGVLPPESVPGSSASNNPTAGNAAAALTNSGAPPATAAAGSTGGPLFDSAIANTAMQILLTTGLVGTGAVLFFLGLSRAVGVRNPLGLIPQNKLAGVST